MIQSAKEKESIYEGIYYSFEDGSPSPFRARYYARKREGNGEKKSRAVRKRFKTELERDKWAKRIDRERRELGKTATALDPAAVKRWELAASLLDPWEDPFEVVMEWRAANPRGNKRTKAKKVTAEQVVSAFMERRSKDPSFDPLIYQSHFSRFLEKFGRWSVEDLHKERLLIARWIEELPLAAWTKKNQKSRVAVAFSEAYSRGEISANPFDRLKVKIGRARQPVEFMRVDDVIELFKANYESPGTCAKLALGLLGGLRTSAVARVEWKDFRFSLQALETPAWKTKTGARDLIQGWPPVVWKWVARAKEEDFAPACPNIRDEETLTDWKRKVGRKWMHQKSDALKAAGLLVTRDDPAYLEKRAALRHPPRNWARHSFATYHATAFEDLARTSTLMSHAETVETLRAHYLGVVEKPEALRFFQVSPRLIERLLA